MTIGAALAGVVILGALATACSGVKRSGVPEEYQSSFMSGGKEIKVEHFAAAGLELEKNGKRPAVIVVHGSDGFLLGGKWYRDAARRVAEAGYETYLVHYFNRTGDWRVTDVEEIHAKVPVWTAAMKDAVTFVGKQPGVDAKRIGIVGISLGGAVGIATAAQDKRVKVLVDYFGFVPKTLTEQMTLPPTLVLHGTSDTVVWPSNAGKLDAFLTARKIPHDVKLYEGEGHAFRGEAGKDADARTAAFLKKYL